MRRLMTILLLLVVTLMLAAADIRKAFLYNKYTLEDNYKYNNAERRFQWDKIEVVLDSIVAFQKKDTSFGILANYKNINGQAPLVSNYSLDAYRSIQDPFGETRHQGIPLYKVSNLKVPFRYAKDGSLVAITADSAGYCRVRLASYKGTWMVPKKYVTRIGGNKFLKVVVVDRHNQNIATLEKVNGVWLVRSMNPVTTGLHRPPYQRVTPLGYYVVQRKLDKMIYLKDGTKIEAGFAPYASRFAGGAYLHGIPINYPSHEIVEFSWSLGTTPRSHMCVRNASSHAKFLYDWAPIREALVVVIE